MNLRKIILASLAIAFGLGGDVWIIQWAKDGKVEPTVFWITILVWTGLFFGLLIWDLKS